MSNPKKIIIAGAGLVGSYLAALLAKRGFQVEVFERRPDPRKQSQAEGRSINLAISCRGLHALDQLEIREPLMQEAIPMKGRMMHSLESELTYQPYGKSEKQFINSISRGDLNRNLINFAAEEFHVPIHFCNKLEDVDFDNKIAIFVNENKGQTLRIPFDVLIGADGANSRVRQAMENHHDIDVQTIASGAGYKELTILPDAKGNHRLEKNALHIWPRGKFMLIALPNFDGSFTCTLFLPMEGPISFENIQTPYDVGAFFRNQFPDAMPLIDRLQESYFENPTGSLSTIKCFPWSFSKKGCFILGDAAHAIIPFFGQGMNCGFEDCTVLDEILSQYPDHPSISWEEVIRDFEKSRKPNTDAIANMSIENFVEMRDLVGDEAFLLKKQVEKILENEFPDQYISRYSMVSFHRTPYHEAYQKGEQHEQILKELCKNIQQPDQVDLKLAKNLIGQL